MLTLICFVGVSDIEAGKADRGFKSHSHAAEIRPRTKTPLATYAQN